MRTLYKPILPPYFTLKYRPSNREEKRLFDREYERVVKELLPVDFKFLAELFGDDIETYKELFTKFNTLYKATAEHLKKNGKLKFIEVNADYFYNEYKPLETI